VCKPTHYPGDSKQHGEKIEREAHGTVDKPTRAKTNQYRRRLDRWQLVAIILPPIRSFKNEQEVASEYEQCNIPKIDIGCQLTLDEIFILHRSFMKSHSCF